MSTDPPTYRTLQQAQLTALLEAHGYTAFTAAKALGKSRMFLYRKLAPDPKAQKPITDADVQAICELVGVSPSVLMRPVLVGDDVPILDWLTRGELKRPNASHVRERWPATGERALERLAGQGLVYVTPAGWLRLTDAGNGLALALHRA